MEKNSKKLKEFEDDFLEKSKLTIEEKFRLYDDMWSHAVKLRRITPKNRLAGIEVDIRIAEVLNSVR